MDYQTPPHDFMSVETPYCGVNFDAYDHKDLFDSSSLPEKPIDSSLFVGNSIDSSSLVENPLLDTLLLKDLLVEDPVFIKALLDVIKISLSKDPQLFINNALIENPPLENPLIKGPLLESPLPVDLMTEHSLSQSPPLNNPVVEDSLFKNPPVICQEPPSQLDDNRTHNPQMMNQVEGIIQNQTLQMSPNSNRSATPSNETSPQLKKLPDGTISLRPPFVSQALPAHIDYEADEGFVVSPDPYSSSRRSFSVRTSKILTANSPSSFDGPRDKSHQSRKTRLICLTSQEEGVRCVMIFGGETKATRLALEEIDKERRQLLNVLTSSEQVSNSEVIDLVTVPTVLKRSRQNDESENFTETNNSAGFAISSNKRPKTVKTSLNIYTKRNPPRSTRPSSKQVQELNSKLEEGNEAIRQSNADRRKKAAQRKNATKQGKFSLNRQT